MFRIFVTILMLAISTANSWAESGLKIAVYGDSTTEGWVSTDGGAFLTRKNVPALLQEMIRRDIDPNAVVYNKGVGGTQASQILLGVDGRNEAWDVEMSQSDASVVMINFSLNDAYFNQVPTPGMVSEGPKEFEYILRTLVKTAQVHGKTVVLLTPNPVCKEPRLSVLPYYVERIKNVATSEQVSLVDHFYATQKEKDWQNQLADCVHPSEAMYADKARREYSVLVPLLSSIN
ncbi:MULTISPECIES: SGNH/GDSL hydrolase family protein [Brucella]|uniref:SGNH/GDSL hydrolase family protein n=1 Tax=Brucella intermedia TaxID=94625 RepID=A0A7V6PF58_9HYPH|nr:SGNH/GDSL hydrolase family protein [Brucella intermedia]WGG60527.1 SGNH/GDSL hydrolase family protein [Brucella intermedia]HHV69859.1 SGNH/GDSL hydrolase family protein [Brucella intermedia]